MMKYANNPGNVQHRHRSHTINHASVGAKEEGNSPSVAVNLCGYDSYLHATICAGNGHHGLPTMTTTSVSAQHSPNMVGVATPIRKKCNQKLIKSRLRHHQLQQQQAAAAAQLAQHQHHHHHQSVLHTQKPMELLASSKKQHRKGHHNTNRLLRSKSKEEMVEKINLVEGLLTTESFIDKLKITEDFAEKHVAATGEEKRVTRSTKPGELIMEYGNVPVTAEPGEVESLLRCTSSATTPNDEVLTVIANGNQNELFIDEAPPSKGGNFSPKASPAHSSSTPKSNVHRYGTHVHTHIHHHYHHFENEENVV